MPEVLDRERQSPGCSHEPAGTGLPRQRYCPRLTVPTLSR